MIDSWWSRCPSANVALACDHRSGLLALDIDPRNDGDLELDGLTAAHGDLPETVAALTGGGGMHYLFARPQVARYKSELRPGVEVKAAGYILVAPSIHPGGAAYQWEMSSRPGEVALAQLPSWILSRVIDVRSANREVESRPGTSFLAMAFARAGWLGRRIDSVRVCVRCPWENEHTTRSPDSATVLFAPRKGSSRGWFHCSHAHCAGVRTLDDVIAALPERACRLAVADVARGSSEDRSREARP